MPSVNKCILIGNLGKDPELRYMTSGDAVVNVSIATTEKWKDKNGEKQEKTEWHNIVFYRKLAEIANEYLKKGSPVYVEGKIETRKWVDKNGIERYTTSINATDMKMLGSKPATPVYQTDDRSSWERSRVKSGFEDMDDDIPY